MQSYGLLGKSRRISLELQRKGCVDYNRISLRDLECCFNSHLVYFLFLQQLAISHETLRRANYISDYRTKLLKSHIIDEIVVLNSGKGAKK